MPSLTHEALLLLFRNRPELAPELLQEALGLELPAYTEVRVESADLSDVVPTEYRADLVVHVHLVDGKPVLAIAVEVQLSRDDRKRFTWPVCATGLRARFECDAMVLVVSPRWTWRAGQQSRSSLDQPALSQPSCSALTRCRSSPITLEPRPNRSSPCSR